MRDSDFGNLTGEYKFTLKKNKFTFKIMATAVDNAWLKNGTPRVYIVAMNLHGTAVRERSQILGKGGPEESRKKSKFL